MPVEMLAAVPCERFDSQIVDIELARIAMRWGRLVFEGVMALGLVCTSFLLWVEWTRVRSPFLPHYIFSYDRKAGSLTVQGTWTLEGDELAWPSQTTTIECERATKRCLEASAVLAGNEQLMPVRINELDVLRWDDDLIVARGPGALCIDEVYNIQVQTQIVTGITSPKSVQPTEACVMASRTSKRMRMIDGHEASRIARGWPRRIAQ